MRMVRTTLGMLLVGLGTVAMTVPGSASESSGPVKSVAPGTRLDHKQGNADEKAKLIWFDAKLLPMEGRIWSDVAAPYDRFPARAEKLVPPAVWGLSRQSAGLAYRFVTDAPTIHAKWTLTGTNLAMPHMPATGVSGLDLYVKTESGRWQWLGVGQPRAKSNQQALVSGLPKGKREFLLYLPLYNGVESLSLGVPASASLEAAPTRAAESAKPLVFYGTSITQGGCASRPGMVHTAILGRKLNRPVINLGFSGNGRMDSGVVELLSEIDAAVFIIDCLPNMNAEQVSERTIPLVQMLRKKRPNTPILLVEDRSYTNSTVLSGPRERNRSSRQALQRAYAQLQADKVPGISYLEGETLLGDDGEGTVDSSHPTDLGFMRQADVMAKVLEPLLKSGK
ncbi:SGNH/GDSL hydrolase family protein [Tuwongella immobilis]|nr:SGNH/GDSL hydrolase family protein [Tuwongella immobilis]